MRLGLIVAALLSLASLSQAQQAGGKMPPQTRQQAQSQAKPRAPQQAKPQTTPANKPQPPLALTAARMYMDLGAWDQAEAQFQKIDSSASDADRREAIEGARQARLHIIGEKWAAALTAARSFERLERWKDAEQSYVDFAKANPSGARIAAGNLERIEPKINNARWPEVIDDWSLKIGRVLLILSILYAIFRFRGAVKEARESIKFEPFRASTDDAAKQLAFHLESTLANLRAPASNFPTWPGLANSLPLMRLPGLGEELDLEDLEIGGVKVPLNRVFKTFAVPRARVSGNWYAGGAGGFAYASVDKRKGFALRFASSTQRAISAAAGAAQDDDLKRFAYAVFIEAGR